MTLSEPILIGDSEALLRATKVKLKVLASFYGTEEGGVKPEGCRARAEGRRLLGFREGVGAGLPLFSPGEIANEAFSMHQIATASKKPF